MGYGFDDGSSSSASRSRRSRSNRAPPFSNRNAPNNAIARSSGQNNKRKEEALQRQTQLYAELAKELEEKLSKRNAEIMALRRSNQVLQQECSGHRNKISNLETQCTARSAKVAQLSDAIASRKSDKVQERLMEKSLEIADLVEENERLKIQKKQLQDDKSQKGKLLLEMSEIVRMLNKIDVVYEKAGENGCYSSLIFPKNRYLDYSLTPSGDLPQDIPMENVRRKIQAMEDGLRERENLRKENNTQKQKLESLRGSNADLNLQIASLEAKLQEHEDRVRGHGPMQPRLSISEASSSTWTTESDESEMTFRTASYSTDGSKEASLDEYVGENGRTPSDDLTEDTGLHDSYRDNDSRDFLFSAVDRSLSTVDECTSVSDDNESGHSSFSSLEAPPSRDEGEGEEPKKSPVKDQHPTGIPPEEHKQLQNNFEKALDVIEKLKNDLAAVRKDNPGIAYKRDSEMTAKDVSKLERELEQAVSQYTMLKGEHKALCDRHEEEMERSKRTRTDLEALHKEKIESLEEASKKNLEELTKRNKNLELQYNDLEAEYTLKIEKLEMKLKEMKHQAKQRKDDSESRCDDMEEELKKHRQEMKQLREEYNAMESVQQERVDALLDEHAQNIKEEKKKFDDLRYEYDTFLEIHLKLEEETEQAKGHYKESLLKIRSLESEAKNSTIAAEKTKTDHNEAIEKAKAAHQESLEKIKTVHQNELKKMEAMTVEWKSKFTKLKRDHVSAVKANNENTQKFIAEIKQLQKEHGIVMAKQGRMRQSDAAKYQKLRRDFDAALVDHGKKEQITIHKFEQSKRAYESKMQACQKKIEEFEKILPLSKKKKLTEQIESIQSESKKRVDQLQAELIERSKRLEEESNERFLKAQTESKERIDQLVETNEKLKELATKHEQELAKSRESQEQVKADYMNLSESYQASLRRIDSLVQQKEEKATKNISDEESKISKGGSVMERIKQLEKKTEVGFSQDKPQNKKEENSSQSEPKNKDEENSLEANPHDEMQENPSSPKIHPHKISNESETNPAFLKEFDMIVTKLGSGSSHCESNLEASSDVSSSVVSSIGSSIAGSMILEAIRKRVEEHTQKMEVTGEDDIVESQTAIVHTFEATHIYDILRHFVQLREVNSSFRRLPRFGTLTEEDRNPEEPVANLDEFRNIDEIVSDLLVHRKRFEGVQSSLMRQITMTQLDELYPSNLIELFPSEYGSSSESVSPSDLGFSTGDANHLKKKEENQTSAEEKSVGSDNTNDSLQEALREAARLQGENYSMQLYMNTEEIRSKTREKEMRLLNLKYQNLRDEFQRMKLAESSQPPSDINIPFHYETDDAASFQPSLAMSSVTTPAMTGIKQIDCFQKKVLNAELKVEYTKREWEQQKSQVNVARKEQKEIDNNLRMVMGQLKDMEYGEGSNDRLIPEDYASLSARSNEDPNEGEGLFWQSEGTQSKTNEGSDIFEHKNTIAISDNRKFSFLVSHLSPMCLSEDSEDNTSNEESHQISMVSLDAQDGKPAISGSETKATKTTADETEPTASVEEDDGDDDDDENENDDSFDDDDENDSSDISSDSNDSTEESSRKIPETKPKPDVDAIQLELRQAKEAAEAARQKQMEREQNLRDVIFHYKKLQQQHNEALAEKQNTKKSGRLKMGGKGKGVQAAQLEKELKQAQANVSVMKYELDVACEQHCEEKEHLREVMSQFQTLQVDFLKVLAEKQELEKAVYQRPGVASGVVPAVISTTGPQPRFLDASGSWVASTVGGPSFEEKPAVSARKTLRPAPDVSPLKQVAGPPLRNPVQTPNNRHANSYQIVKLCDDNRVPPTQQIRPQGQTNSLLTPHLPQRIPASPNTNKSLRSSRTNQSTLVKTPQQQRRQFNPLQQQQQQRRQFSPLQQQQQQFNPPQQQQQQQFKQPQPQHHHQQQLRNMQLQSQKHPSQLQQPMEKYQPQVESPSKKPAGKRKKGIFRGWRSRPAGASQKQNSRPDKQVVQRV